MTSTPVWLLPFRRSEMSAGNEVVGLEKDLAGLEVDDVGDEERALEVGGLDLHLDRLALFEVGDHRPSRA